MIILLSQRNKCWSCKHRFSEPILLPVEKPVEGKFQPNISSKVLFHNQETHGIPHDITREWIIGLVYGRELTEFGMRKCKMMSINKVRIIR